MEIKEAESFFENFIEQVKDGKADFGNDVKQVEDATIALKKEMIKEYKDGNESPDHWFYFFVSSNMTKESLESFSGNVNDHNNLVSFNQALLVASEQNQKEKIGEYESFLRIFTQEKQKFMDKSIER